MNRGLHQFSASILEYINSGVSFTGKWQQGHCDGFFCLFILCICFYRLITAMILCTLIVIRRANFNVVQIRDTCLMPNVKLFFFSSKTRLALRAGLVQFPELYAERV